VSAPRSPAREGANGGDEVVGDEKWRAVHILKAAVTPSSKGDVQMIELTTDAAVGAEPVAAIPNPDHEAAPSAVEPAPAAPLVEYELLVEDISIDGMCGVY
jgi:mycofactocin precursor